MKNVDFHDYSDDENNDTDLRGSTGHIRSRNNTKKLKILMHELKIMQVLNEMRLHVIL